MDDDGSTPPSRHVADLERVFEIESHGPDVWIGESPDYSWGRIFGGLVIAQALWAATKTVTTSHGVHSLHGYFILGGNPDEPVRYEVDRIRNGRSFTTRRVVARQSSGAIFSLSCSFQAHEEGSETQIVTRPIDAPEPDERHIETNDSGIERIDIDLGDQPRSLSWARYPISLGDDPAKHACALAYLSDNNPMDAVAMSHPSQRRAKQTSWHEHYMLASLDHAMWFHRRVQADDWVLFDTRSKGILRTRGLATGEVFDASGSHLATIAQEGLIRELRAAP